MAKTIDQVVKEQLGSLLFEIAVLTSQNSELADKLKALQSNVREPDKKHTPAKE